LTERYKVMDVLARYVSKWVPVTEPNFKQMEDDDFIVVLSWCNTWDQKKVYYKAYKLANLDYAQTYGEWNKNRTPLPVAVRYQLEQGVMFHHKNGNLNALKTYSYFYQSWPKLVLYTGLGLLLLYLLS